MKKLLIPLLGLVPFSYQYILLLTGRLNVPNLLMFAVFLALWILFAWIAKQICGNGRTAILLLNLPAAVMLLWVGIISFVPGIPWPDLPGFVHSTPLYFYLPFAQVSMLYYFIPPTVALYALVFLILIIASRIGCSIKTKA